MPQITYIMTDEGSVLASDTFETDYLAVAISHFEQFLIKGGFVLPGALTVSGAQRDIYQEVVDYYNSTENLYQDNVNLD